MTARLSLYTIYDTTDIRIGGQTVPLEYDQTAVRALFVVEGKGWTRGTVRAAQQRAGRPKRHSQR